MSRQYGFIGLGSQGAPMASRMIEAGLPVLLWARRPQTLAPFTRTTAKIVSSLASFAEQVDYVGICVVDDEGVEQLCDQLIPAMKAGACIVIHSTVSPELCNKLAIVAASYKLDLIDAPVSGDGQGAAEGTLAVMVGGDTAVVESVRPVFETFAKTILHLGEVGAGQQAKLINNAMMAANLAIAYHGLEIAKALGIDRQAFIDLINVSSARSFSFDVAARMEAPEKFTHGARLLAKDMFLLEAALKEMPSFKSIRETAQSFLDHVA